MRDPWNPTWEEIRAWAHASDPDPCEDWALACSWKEGYFRDYVQLVASADCARRRFFLDVLYLAVGNKVSRGCPAWQVEALIEAGDGVRHRDVARWQERSRALVAAPGTYDHFDWGGGGWSGMRRGLQDGDLVQPWTGVPDSSALDAELARELAPWHPLHGTKPRAIARREDNDDVLFALEDGPAPFAVVHLTWRGEPEPDPAWPAFELHETLSDWRRDGMQPDHEAWSAT